jgi:DNA-binding CsgD family transcriptional regulator
MEMLVVGASEPSGARSPHADVLKLTPRQREVLEWSAQGKTSWEISIIIQCTEATVNYHLKTACQKLQARNKTHAVFKMMLSRCGVRLDDLFDNF